MLEDVLLAVICEPVEAPVSLVFTTEFVESQSLIENLVGAGIVVVKRWGGFLRAKGGLHPAVAGFGLFAKAVVGNAKQIIEIVLLCSL